MHKYWLTAWSSLPRKNMVWWTDRPAMTIAVDLGCEATKQTNWRFLSQPTKLDFVCFPHGFSAIAFFNFFSKLCSWWKLSRKIRPNFSKGSEVCGPNRFLYILDEDFAICWSSPNFLSLLLTGTFQRGATERVCLFVIWFFTSTQQSFSYAGRFFLGLTSTKLE